ncbi:glycosyltransferase family protein [Megalodesulfovibrio paquesii]
MPPISVPPTYNILMYSHDTYGLGHIRRTLAIASQLVGEGVNILILTGSPIVGRFNVPEGIDFVRIPGMIKKSNTVYLPHSIKVNARHALHIRRNIITATARAFDPSLFIVDKVPLGLKREVAPTLNWFRKTRPQTKVILGLRDILDDAESTRQEWEERGDLEAMDKLYSEIWVYGMQELYDPIKEYGIPESISKKMRFTGYIPRFSFKKAATCPPQNLSRNNSDKLRVLVTIGGGGDGFPVLDTYLRMVEQTPDLPFRSSIVCGPFLQPELRDELAMRAKAVGVYFTNFVKKMEKQLLQADLVVGMGGYNTICEILSQRKPCLIIPRDNPRREQLIRAQIFKEHGLADYLPWGELTPDALRNKIVSLSANLAPYHEAMARFPMTGLEVMRQRLQAFREGAA